MNKPKSKLAEKWTLPTDRPASFDEKGWRVYLHPAEVRGLWKNRRTIVQAVLVLIFLTLPWLRIGGEQALLLNVADRKFEIFGLSLRAHNAPLLFFVLAIAGFGLFLVTAIWGRVWCGWACPQTVFIESVFRRIEKWIDGSAAERRALDLAPLNLRKVAKRALKWTLFTLAAGVITHSFLAYFVGTDRITEMVLRPPSENWSSFLFIVFSTAIILFDFGWFREQFCIIACPYGRFQSVLMDKQSMVVGFDTAREKDCVECFRCVQVCPTGIDIRRGVQMECIACTACVDACDEVMTKVKRPLGLIRYMTQLGLKPSFRLSPRVAAYAAIVIGSVASLSYLLANHRQLDVQVLRGTGAPYVKTADGRLLNQFFLEASNSGRTDLPIQLAVLKPEGARIVNTASQFVIRAGRTERIGFFIEFTADPKQASATLQITAEGVETESKQVNLVQPL